MPAKARTSQLPTESISPQKARPMFHPCSPYSLRHRVTSSTRGCPPAISSATEDQTDKAQSHLAQTVRAESKPAHGTESSREICSPSPSMLNLSEQIPPCSRKRKDCQRNRLGRSQQAPTCPRNRSPREIWLGRSNRSRADLAGTWTTRAQVRRVPADPTVGRKPKACQ